MESYGSGFIGWRVYRLQQYPCVCGEKKRNKRKTGFHSIIFLLICLTIVAACDNEMGPREKKWMQGKCETPELMEGDRSGNET